ncbi:MAG TPA: hypothetical protein VMU31_11575 [Rhizomicrobium sp.]|nr:hypothetical protein [Rhizomicrobium sp.]
MNEISERNSVLIAYGLYLLGAMSGGLTTLGGMVLAYARLDGARGTPYESHYRNMLLVFWVWLAVIVVAGMLVIAGVTGVAFSFLAVGPIGGLSLIPAGFALWLIGMGVLGTIIWYYWRLVRGLVLSLDDKPY